MKRASGQYSIAMNKQLRDRGYAVAVIGIINLDAQQNVSVTSDILYLSGKTDIFNMDLTSSPQYATFEENVFKMDGSQYIPPSDENFEQFNTTAVISRELDGSIEISFKLAFDIKGLTIMFTEFYPTSFKITTNNGLERTYSNDSENFETTDNLGKVTSITITPLEFKGGNNKRLRIRTLLLGVGVSFTNNDISNLTLSDTTSFVSEELPSRTLQLDVLDPTDNFNVDNDNSFLPFLQTGQEITSWLGQTLSDGSVEYVKLPIMYLTDWAANNHKASFIAKNRLSTLVDPYSIGNYIHSRSLYAEAISVLTDAGLEPDEYYVDDSLQDITISAPMPVKSHAECLQLIANAGRCALLESTSGVIMLAANFENIVDPTDLTIVSNTHTKWAHPSNIRNGAVIEYADLTRDYFKLDGSMYLLDSANSDYLATGFISQQVADDNGNFFDNLLPVPYLDDNLATRILSGDFTRAGVNIHASEDGILTLDGVAESNFYLMLYRAPNDDRIVEEYRKYRLASYGDELPTGATLHFSYRKADNDIIAGLTDITVASDSVYTDFIASQFIDDWNKSFIFYEIQKDAVFNHTVLKPLIVCLDDYAEAPAGYVQGKAPSLEMLLPASFSYFGLHVRFGGHHPTNATVTTFNNGTQKYSATMMPDSNDYYMSDDFLNFDQLKIKFNKTSPNSRVVLNELGFGTITDYYLRKNDMLNVPVGTLETKTKNVLVRVFTYTEPTREGESPKALDDNVYEEYIVNNVGSLKKFENPIIDSHALAQDVAEWLGNYYANNVTYNVKYRGDPRIDGADYIFMENDYHNNLQVEVEALTLQFNGALSGTLDLRRASNLTLGGD